MRNVVNLSLLGAMCFMLVGCGGVSNFHQPGSTFATAFLYSDVKGGSQVLDNGTAATKTGKACSQEILGVIATGDTRVETAMTNGAITKLVYVNTSFKNILGGAYAEVCTIARGN